MKPDSHVVFSFPQKAPEGSVKRNDMSAIEQLKHWKVFAEYYTEHNPSTTVYVREEEWLDVGAWVYRNFESIRGISFLPHSEHIYKQAPYEEIDRKEYERLSAEFPNIEWEAFEEETDNVQTYKELACTAGYCEV
jgi:ribonucleoside-diphosphate reductase alpha chain